MPAAVMSAASKKRKRKPSEFHSEVTRERIRATLLVERLQACALGEIDLSPVQVRAIEILLRKVLPDLSKTEINDTSPHRYVVEMPAELTQEEWEKKYSPPKPTVQ